METTLNLQNDCAKTDMECENLSKNQSFHVEEFHIKNTISNETIYGKIYIPNGTSKSWPTIIISHGYNGCCDSFLPECEYFASHGYVAIAFDFCGGSTRSQSSMSTICMSLFTEKSDLLSVLSYAKELNYVDNSKIFLLGGSQGGFVTALTAEEIEEQICGMILYYPAFCIPDNWRDNLSELKQLPKIINFWDMPIGEPYFKCALSLNTFEEIGKFSKNVLIIHGDLDTVVPLSYSQKAVELYPNAKLFVLENEEHGFSEKGTNFSKRITLNFMNDIINNL